MIFKYCNKKNDYFEKKNVVITFYQNYKTDENVKNGAIFEKFTFYVSFFSFECVKIKLKRSIQVKLQ